MIPNIFISSTIADLLHLREALRDTVADLGYHPVLSEYGGVGFLPGTTAEESCYLTVRQCHAAVVIIAKRYGSIGRDGVSVTQNEFRAARTEGLPVFCLVDRDLLSFKTVFDEQPTAKTTFPGMDNAVLTFSFLREVMEASTNNAILPFTNASDAREQLKAQFAHLFAEMLRQKFNPISSDVRDVLSEIKTLRHDLSSSKTASPDPRFLRAVRLMLDDKFDLYRSILKILYPAMELGIETLLKSSTFDEFIEKSTTHPPVVREFRGLFTKEQFLAEGIKRYTTAAPRWPLLPGIKGGIDFGVGEGVVYVNKTAHEYFRALHDALQRELSSLESLPSSFDLPS